MRFSGPAARLVHFLFAIFVVSSFWRWINLFNDRLREIANNVITEMMRSNQSNFSASELHSYCDQGLERFPHLRPPISDPPSQAPHVRPPHVRPPMSDPPSEAPHLRPPILDSPYQAPHFRPPILGPPSQALYFRPSSSDPPSQAPSLPPQTLHLGPSISGPFPPPCFLH